MIMATPENLFDGLFLGWIKSQTHRRFGFRSEASTSP